MSKIFSLDSSDLTDEKDELSYLLFAGAIVYL